MISKAFITLWVRGLGFKSSCAKKVFWKKAVLINFANFTGKHQCWSLFLIKRLQHRCFSVKFAKLLRTHFLKNICEWVLLDNWNLWSIVNLKYCIINNVLFLLLHSLNAKVSIIQKPVNWFAEKINWRVSIWSQLWRWISYRGIINDSKVAFLWLH